MQPGAHPWCKNASNSMERVTGIEPAPPVWKTGVLPLNYTRVAENHQPKLKTSARRNTTRRGTGQCNSVPTLLGSFELFGPTLLPDSIGCHVGRTRFVLIEGLPAAE